MKRDREEGDLMLALKLPCLVPVVCWGGMFVPTWVSFHMLTWEYKFQYLSFPLFSYMYHFHFVFTIDHTKGTNGFMTSIGNRGDDLEMRFLKPMFELGRSRFVFYSPRDRDSIAEVIADSDIVINVTGKYYETKHLVEKKTFPYLDYTTNYTFQETNVEIPKMIAELCTEMQVDNLIHVSSINAAPDSNCTWTKTKFEGEMAVREAFPWATVVRPSQMFGHEDRLLNWFANSAERLPLVPLFEGGHALTQPVYAVDVADAIQRIVDAPDKFEGRTVDCFGAQDYSYKELAAFVYDITGQEPRIMDLPKEVAKNVAKGFNLLGTPMLTPDMVEMWSEDFIPSMTQEEYDAQPTKDKIFSFKDLGIEATPIEKIAFSYLHRFREGGHFSLAKGYH
jgi:NADH dehydrogenase (ubiquinone) 1 alpha subcomplex subunit 9